MLTVYLAGPIHGCTDAEAIDWRAEVQQALSGAVSLLDPMRRDYRGREDANVRELVEQDKADIRASDVVLVNAERPTWGTAMEVGYAYTRGKRVLAVCGAPTVSPWLRYHAEVYRTFGDAVLAIFAERAA